MKMHTINRGRWIGTGAATLVAVAFAAGCVRHQVDPIQVEPMHITVDVNLRVDRELDEFFEFEEEIEQEIELEQDDATSPPPDAADTPDAPGNEP